jgi:hypothetical protein|tara:strand:+ start:2064 stop:2360 length:297 start_codon:yes stop_codon:yes gene_type:complete
MRGIVSMLLGDTYLAARTCFLEVGARTATSEKTSRLPKLFYCALKGIRGLGLINDLAVPKQPMCLEPRENAFDASDYRARRVNVVDPELPRTEMMSSV